MRNVMKNLKHHIVNIHLNIEKTCDLCSQKFRPDNLKRHKEICSRGLKTNEADEEEMMDFFDNETGGYQNSFKQFAKKEICHHCSKPLSNKASLKVHVSDVQMSNNKKTCKFCKNIFSSKSNLTKHMRNQHKSYSPNVAQFGPSLMMIT